MKISRLKRILNPCKFVAARTLSTNVSYQNGQQIHGYVVKRVSDVNEFSMTAVELEHLKTGCQHLHLIRDDKNNVFNISLQTTPMNSTGVAHVLEHVALCGSQKFPVRDPFFKMLDRSMSTFMNAMTGPDYTMYPFSTQNSKDFKNLMSVYLDSVFFPQIRKLDFLQEGWRLEHENNQDQSSPITFKGVVFNEMKGMLSDPSYLFGTALMNKLLPDHTYGVCSGGKPDRILDLTWQDLKDFHARHYHPSNARVITYGDMPMEGHLEQINEVLEKFSKIDPGTAVPNQAKWSEAKSYDMACPPDELSANPEKQTTVALTYLLPETSDIQEMFTAVIICNLLMDGPAAPLYKALIESGLGSSYSPQSGFHSHQKESIFSIGLQGIFPDDADSVKELIEKTLADVARDGLPRDRIEAILHRIELQQKHQSSQFGLGLSFNVMPTWQHGADPIRALKVDEMVESFRKQLDRDENFVQKKCEQYFTTNAHRHTLVMSPDPKYFETLDVAEREKLNNRVGALSVEDKTQIYEEGLELSRGQQEESDVSCLPTLHVSDIPLIQQNYQVALHKSDGQPLIATCPQPTNGLTYFDAVFPVNEIKPELKPYLPLFCQVLNQMGTRSTDYVAFSQREDMCTGGLGAHVTSHGYHGDAMTSETAIGLHSHCLDRNVDAMFELWREIFQEVTFEDSTRLQTLIRQSAQELANGVSYQGHVFAMSSAAQHLSPSAADIETFSGLTQVNFMRQAAEADSVDDVIVKLRQIAAYALQSADARFCLHATPEFMTQAMTSLEGLIANIPKEGVENLKSSLIKDGVLSQVGDKGLQSLVRWNAFESQIKHSTRAHHELPLPVNFVSMAVRTPAPYSHQDAPALRLLARLMSAKFLHREIREMGGAYGGGARHDGDGIFRFFSYRDPNNVRTLERFREAVTWAREGRFESRDIDEAKLAVFQKVDSPVSPSGRGQALFVNGLDDVTRQRHRDRLLGVDREQLIQVANEYLDESRDSSAVVIGPADEKLAGVGMAQQATSSSSVA